MARNARGLHRAKARLVIPAFISSSGGKDSCLALWRARRAGYDVRVMLTMLDETGLRNRSHGVPLALLREQAASLGMTLRAPSASWKDYETVMMRELAALRRDGFEAGVFGDIDLDAHREWEEKVCAQAGLSVHLPLWHESRLELAHEVLELGFKAIVVCVDARFLDDSYCGRAYDAQFIASLPAGVDACGENGEFHTFVHDGPGFQHAIRVEVIACEPYVSPPEFGAQRYCFARLSGVPDIPAEG